MQGVNWDAPIRSQFQQVFTQQNVGGRAFIEAILNDLPVSPNFYDGWQAQRVIDAALESEREGKWVSLLEE